MTNKKAVKRKKDAKQRKTTKRKWSATVTEHSDALDVKSKIFTNDDPAYIAKSLRKSALKSRRKKERHTSRPCRRLISTLIELVITYLLIRRKYWRKQNQN